MSWSNHTRTPGHRGARGRLLIRRDPPASWRGPWFPGNATARCTCGAPVVVRSAAFRRCDRGCLRFPPRPSLPRAVPPPPPPPAPGRYDHLLAQLRLLCAAFAADVRKGRRPSARAVELALQAAEGLAREYPDRDPWTALPWLGKHRAAAGRTA